MSFVEVELSLAWGKENPTLFVEAFQKFADKYVGLEHEIDLSRKGFVTLTANLKGTPL